MTQEESMQLTILTVNMQHAPLMNELADANQLFKRVRSLFGHHPHEMRELFRVWRSTDGQLHILVQSAVPADITAWPLAYVDAVRQCDLRPIWDRISAGQCLAFDVIASISKRSNGHEIPLRRDADRTTWLKQKGVNHGFAVADDGDSPLPLHWHSPSVHAGEKGKQQRVVVAPARAIGQLQVCDMTSFGVCLQTGIGRSKALGLGLIVLPQHYLPPEMQ
jgi:CRISPR-associated protein Cas6/Cse3/CasE subtype I-E